VSTTLLETSVFHHLSATPAVPLNLTSATTMAMLGVFGIVLSTVAFTRRDLMGR
jgi:hypothetical protein